MKKLDKKWKIVLYGCSGLGINLLNLIIGSYLCSALLVGGFDQNAENWTYLNRDLVVAGLWSVLILVSKIVDGIIDIPLSSFTDNLQTRFGRRRPAILIGYLPLLISYLLFLVPLKTEAGFANTLWFALLLCVFYASYTLTMVTYYATFAEVVVSSSDRVLLSNVKSVCDVIYFILGYALVPAFVGMGLNIRVVAVLFLPLAATMLIPFFLIQETSTEKDVKKSTERFGLIHSFSCSFRNRKFLFWLCNLSVMNFGLQLFLSGINEFFSTTGLNMTFVMASTFAPVPFTLLLYNKIVKRRGLRFAFQYVLLVFAIGMGLMSFCRFVDRNWLLLFAVFCGVIASFSVGAFFSVSYTIPSQLAAEENHRSGICASSMYFAVQGLFEGISAGLASGVVLVFLKQHDLIGYMTAIVAVACLLAFGLAFLLPESIASIGKE